MALESAEITPLTDLEAREVGVLLGRHTGRDVPDGHLALLARRHVGRAVATGDRGYLEALGVGPDRVVDV